MIGVLGGSFNPAHDGHVHISMAALRYLRLDQVWWLVSPQNPLKSKQGMAPLADRMRKAEQLVGAASKIKVSGVEQIWGTRYTADTLAALRRHFPCCRFVWLMGADNLQQISHWERWTNIFRSVAVAVFDRSPYSREAMASKAALRFGRWRRIAPGRLMVSKPPAWVFMHIKRHPASATQIRRRTGA